MRSSSWGSQVMAIGCVALLLGFVALAAPPAESQVPDDRVVVAGSRIGKWTLTMTVDDLVRMNGPANTRSSAFSDFVPNVFWYAWESLGIGAASHDRRHVDYLAVHQVPDYQTQKGIGYKAGRKALVAAYGEPTVESDVFVRGRIVTRLFYEKQGMAFFLLEDVVQLVLIFRPGSISEMLPDCG